MDPATFAAIIAFVSPIVIALITLTLSKLIDWFKARRRISASNKNAIGVIIAKRINDRNYVEIPGVFRSRPAETEIVQAIFDQRTGQVLDGRAVRSGRTDDQSLIRRTDDGDGMVIFT